MTKRLNTVVKPRSDAAMTMHSAPFRHAGAGTRRFRRALILLTALVAATALYAPTALRAQEGQPVKIGVVRMNEALNQSVAGQRSKKLLMAAKTQKEQELKAKEEELKRLNEQLQNNIMLSEEARGQKQQELKERQQQLRRAVQEAQKELQQQERRLTQSIFSELSTVVDIIAKERNFDFVLEDGASQVILFSKYDFVDITDAVIQRYNEMQSADGGGSSDGGSGSDDAAADE